MKLSEYKGRMQSNWQDNSKRHLRQEHTLCFWSFEYAKKTYIWKCRLFMLSAEYSCKLFKPIICIQANSVDPDQTAPLWSSLIWVHTVCKIDFLNKSQAYDKADDNCCDWRFKG